MAAMPTNVAIEDYLIEKAQQIGVHQTKKATVAAALEEYIQRHSHGRAVIVTGDFNSTYSDKKQRRKR